MRTADIEMNTKHENYLFNKQKWKIKAKKIAACMGSNAHNCEDRLHIHRRKFY